MSDGGNPGTEGKGMDYGGLSDEANWIQQLLAPNNRQYRSVWYTTVPLPPRWV